MSTNRTARSIRHVLLIATGLALLVMPAAAAVSAQANAQAAADGMLVADGAIAEAPAVVSWAAPAGSAGAAAQASNAATALDGADTSSAAAASQGAAAAVPTDESGSTEAAKVQRSCGASADPHYVPASGKDSNQCYDSDGKFRSSWKYSATHYTNDVQCGRENLIKGDAASDTWIFGAADADGGYASVCSDEFVPLHGRVTASADADGSATVVVDGDKDNPEETTQGWASGTVSADGPEYRCGKSYADGGRGTADAPQNQDNADQCSP